MFRTFVRVGLAVAMTVASLGTARAAAPTAADPARFAGWAAEGLAGEVPAALAATSGTFRTAPGSDTLTGAQAAAARGLVPLGYVSTAVNRDGLLLTTTSFYGSREGVLMVVRAARLASATAVPAALPVATVVTAGYVRTVTGGWASVAEVRAPDGSLLGVTRKDTTAGAVMADECNCGAALAAVAAFGSVCGAATPFMGPAAPVWGVGCAVTVAVAAFGAGGYCETCKGTKGVTLNPGWAEGWQSTDHPDTRWTVCYSSTQLDGHRIAMQINAPMNFLTPPGAAVNNCRVFTGSFACCTTYDRVYDVNAWVEYPVGDWGYVTGKVTVYHYGA